MRCGTQGCQLCATSRRGSHQGGPRSPAPTFRSLSELFGRTSAHHSLHAGHSLAAWPAMDLVLLTCLVSSKTPGAGGHVPPQGAPAGCGYEFLAPMEQVDIVNVLYHQFVLVSSTKDLNTFSKYFGTKKKKISFTFIFCCCCWLLISMSQNLFCPFSLFLNTLTLLKTTKDFGCPSNLALSNVSS